MGFYSLLHAILHMYDVIMHIMCMYVFVYIFIDVCVIHISICINFFLR